MSDRRDFSLPFPRYTLSVEQLVLAASVFWAVALNRPFFSAALRGQSFETVARTTSVTALQFFRGFRAEP